MVNLFISYARENVEQVKLLAAALESDGWSVFWDRSSLLAGQDFEAVIEQAIKEADCMIVAWSAAAKQSDWVRGEATIVRERKILVPILLESIDPPNAFRTLHSEDFVGWYGDKKSEAYLALCKALTSRMKQAKAEQLVKQTRLKNQTKHSRWSLVSATKITAIIGAVASLFAVFLTITQFYGNPQKKEAAVDKVPSPPKTIQITRSDQARLPVKQNWAQIKEPVMVKLPGGTIYIGSNQGADHEKPVHSVTIDRFSIGQTEVTFDDYDRFAEATDRSKPDDLGWGRAKRPVINVNWDDAEAYAAWLSKETGKNFHLPSDAQWEYAARAGSHSDYYWQNNESPKEFAWFTENSGKKTHPVGELKPNDFGLYDMSGNVWEWVQDCWHENYTDAPADGIAWQKQNGGDCSMRMVRGGSWFHPADRLRSAARYGEHPDQNSSFIGFRLAQD